MEKNKMTNEARSLLKKMIKETMQFLDESIMTTDILNSAFKNAKMLSGNNFDVDIDDFKLEVEKLIKSLEKSKLSESEKFALRDLLNRIPTFGRFGPRDVYFAIQQLNSDAPAASVEKIDMTDLPSPSQVNISEIMAKLSREMPNIFGPESESEPDSAYLASLINPSDKSFFSHGMEYGATTNVRGEEKKIFPKDAAGNPIRRPDGSVVFFKHTPRLTVDGVIYDIYTNSFVSHRIFQKRNKVYRAMWAKKQLPGPIQMKAFRTSRFER